MFLYPRTSCFLGAVYFQERPSHRLKSGGGGARNAIDVVAINQSTAEAIMYTEQAYTAMQKNDSQRVFENLDLALNELENIQGNLTWSASESSPVSGINRDSNTSAEATTPSTPTPQAQ